MNKVIVIALLAFALNACAPHTAGIMASSTGEQRIDNTRFNSEVSVERVMVVGQGDPLKAAGTISSKVATDLRLQYKFTWYDINGLTIEDEGVSWKSLKLHGKQQMQVSAVAPNSSAVRCELYVRKAFSN
ncbi:YcfL family protein [Shewanella colwelliana]|uniref:YcfL family protein n=1 Tax=Shewanella colwelliana TaxID=23 RepID=UPI0022AEE71E|nr:YcfL family protein [Shewanella colwelliana]MCZ4337026.1 YcfL family protein [Shewanella colwelliana]